MYLKHYASYLSNTLPASETPETILGDKLRTWFDSSTIESDGSIYSLSGEVLQWNDKASGNHLYKNGAGTASLVDYNGRKVVDFDGAVDFRSNSKNAYNFLNYANNTVFMVCRVEGTDGVDDFMGIINNGGWDQAQIGLDVNYESRKSRNPPRTDQIHYRNTNGGTGYNVDGIAYTYRALSDDGFFPRNSWSYIHASFEKNKVNSLDVEVRINELLVAAVEALNEGSTNNSTDFFMIGSAGSFSLPSYFTGKFAELIICDDILTTEETDSIVNYLKNKWDLTPAVETREFPYTEPWFASYEASGPRFTTEQGLSNNDPVAEMDGESRYNDYYPLVQATAGKRPLFKAGQLNGAPVIESDGVDDILKIGPTANNKFPWSTGLRMPNTIVFIGKLLNTSDGTLIEGLAKHHIIRIASGNIEIATTGGSIVGPAANTDPFVIIAEYNGANSRMLVNGVEFTGNLGTAELDGITVFADTTENNHVAAQMAFIGIYDEVLSDTQIAELHTWANTKYGIL